MPLLLGKISVSLYDLPLFFSTEKLKSNQHIISTENENYKKKGFQKAWAVTCVLSHMVPLETK